MRLWLIAIVGVGVLAAAIVVTAVSSVNGAPRGEVLDRQLVSGPPRIDAPPVPLSPCALGGGAAASAVRVAGPCHGVLGAPFACLGEGEVQALSLSRPVGGGRTFFLTILISDFKGPGDYFEDEIAAQISGPGAAPRWSSSGSNVNVHLAQDGVYTIGDGVLLPVLGTPADGVLEVSGRAECA